MGFGYEILIMDYNIQFEILAEAFRLMTGYMAPGKDTAAAAGAAPIEERIQRWGAWNVNNQEIISAMLRAVDKVYGSSG